MHKLSSMTRWHRLVESFSWREGGLNLTHSEPFERFLSRYGARRAQIAPLLESFSPDMLRAWALGLGIHTFVGSSGRVFPADLKAAPLLRAWLRRLRQAGVQFHMRHRWSGWDDQGALSFVRQRGFILSRPMPWCLRLAVELAEPRLRCVVGAALDRTRGSHCAVTAGELWFRCGLERAF